MKSNLYKIVLVMLLGIFLLEKGNAQICVGNTPQWQWQTHSNWFFGDSVYATFPSGTGAMQLRSLPEGNNIGKLSYEGTSVFSDEKGVLQYYSNGTQLWRADGTFVNTHLLAGDENGASFGTSSVEGVLFVRHPLNPNKLYIFTVDDSQEIQGTPTPTRGFNYSVLNLADGSITSPVCLVNNVQNSPIRTTELLAATLHSNGQDIWISAVGSPSDPTLSTLPYNNVYTFLLTQTGIATNPVVSQISYSNTPIININEDRGSLKFSWDGTKAATVHSSQYGDQYLGIVIYDFDKTSGLFSNSKAVGAVHLGGGASINDSYNKVYDGNYDCEFSPDSKSLYVVGWDYYNSNQTNPASFSQLLWVDFTNYSTPADINGHIKVLSSSLSHQGQIKLGGDGKLYQAVFGQSYLNVFSGNLNTPINGGGTLNTMQESAFSLGGKLSRRGLPHMFIPPANFIEITPKTPLTLCSAPVNLQASWWCDASNAENPSTNPTGWSGIGITDAANGIFNPSIAGEGFHKITYTVNAFQSNSITLEVGSEGCVIADTSCPYSASSKQWQWKTNSNWFFGEGVLGNFPSGTGNMQVSNLSSSKLSYEGTATYSDENGVLKYYSNGNKLWKANGNLITDQLLAGNEGGVTSGTSAVQGVLFVKHPDDNRYLYIFTVDDYVYSNNWNGFNYRVLDMQQDTVSPSHVLKDANGQPYRTTEQLDATFHANGKDIWIATRHSFNDGEVKHRNIYCYRLNASGLVLTPVVSQTPAPLFMSDLSSDRGALKFSWNGKRAATTNYIGAGTKERGVIVYDFDNATGQFNNAKAVAGIPDFYWSTQSNSYIASMGHAPGTKFFDGIYDCEFSPDSRKLYLTGYLNSYSTSSLFVIDVTKPTVLEINASAKIIYNYPALEDKENDIKLGGDGNLYQSIFGQSNINVFSGDLNHPFNSGGTLAISRAPLSLGSRTSRRGFSNQFIPVSDNLKIVPQSQLLTCGSSVDLQVNWMCKGTSAEDPTNNPNGWSGNGITISNQGTGIFDPALAGVGVHQITYTLNAQQANVFIEVVSTGCIIDTTCVGCITYAPTPGKRYVLSAWVSEDSTAQNPYPINSDAFLAPSIELNFMAQDGSLIQSMSFTPSGNVVNGWQRIEKDFVIPLGSKKIEIVFVNGTNAGDVFFDDFRIHPFNASMVSYVYNQETMQLQAQLDENNFYTKYIYDEEGNLVKTKVETIDGVRTAAETRSNIQRK